MKLATRILSLVVISALFAVVQNKLLWGYWWQRPSMAHSLNGIDKLVGISSLPPGSLSQGSSTPGATANALAPCRPVSNECLEGRLLLALDGHATEAAEMQPALLSQVWVKEEADRPLPLATDASIRTTVRPESGLGIHFFKGSEEYVLVAYRSSEAANDRYVYSEAMYRLTGGKLTLVDEDRFYYEVAGFESIDWRVLWPLDLVVLSVLWLLAEVIRRRVRPRRLLVS